MLVLAAALGLPAAPATAHPDDADGVPVVPEPPERPDELPVVEPEPGMPPAPIDPADDAVPIWHGDDDLFSALARAERVAQRMADLPVAKTTGPVLRGDPRDDVDERLVGILVAWHVLAAAADRAAEVEARVTAQHEQLAWTEASILETTAAHDAAVDRMQRSAAELYMGSRGPNRAAVEVVALARSGDPLEASRARAYVQEAFGGDRDRRDRLVAKAEQLVDDLAAGRAELGDLAAERTRAQAVVGAATQAFSARVREHRAALEADLVFPVWGPYVFIDSLGFPRSGGRYHHGADLMADTGTPLVAVESGTLRSVGWQRLGGWRLWLEGDSGLTYYYAHLDAFAPGIADGMRVRPGDLVGYVGDSGNAKGGPPHLHFEVHQGPGAGASTLRNPYEFLRRILRPDDPTPSTVPTPLVPDVEGDGPVSEHDEQLPPRDAGPPPPGGPLPPPAPPPSPSPAPPSPPPTAPPPTTAPPTTLPPPPPTTAPPTTVPPTTVPPAPPEADGTT